MKSGVASPTPLLQTDTLAQLIDQSPDVIAQYDASRRYRRVSTALANSLGLTPSEIVGQTHQELSQRSDLPSHLKAYLAQIEASLEHVLTTGQTETIIHQRPRGDALALEETSYTPLLSPDGQVESVVTISRDSTHCPTLRPEAGGQRAEASVQAIVGAAMPEADRDVGGAEAEVAPMLPVQASPSVDLISASAELLQVVLDNIPQYIFWKDRNSTYLGCNRRWAEMAGIGTPENAVGLSEADLPWTPEQRDWYLECDRRVMETDTPMLRIKQSQLQADGRLTWRETSKLPLHDAAGNVIGLLGTIEDVTDRKIAEDLLKQSEAKFRKLAQQEELLNHISRQVRQSLNLETILQTAVQELRQLFETDRVLVYKFEHDWQGQVIVEAVREPWSSTLGEVGTDVCFSQELASLYQEGRVRAIADITQAGLDECHLHYLQQLQVQANLTVPILVQDTLWGLLLVHQCDQPRQWKELEIELLQSLAGQVGVAIRQAELYEQARTSAAQSQEQAARLETALQELKSTQAQLIQTEKMSGLGQLVAGVAHEINNPVNFIYGNVGHIRTYVQDMIQLIGLYREHYPNPASTIADHIDSIDLDYLLEDLEKVLASVRLGADRIRQIVLSLRNFSRLDEAEMKAVNIHEGLDSTLLILQHRFKAHTNHPPVEVEKHYGNLPNVECYPSQLNQVFMNLIANAIDALEHYYSNTPGLAEKPRIAIATRVDQHSAIISIQDNGPGIPPAIQARLFDPFFTTKPVGKGTGLGLSISHQIVVETHSGQLTCHSQPGSGTEFRVTIPLEQIY